MSRIDQQRRQSVLNTVGIALVALFGGVVGLVLFYKFGSIAWSIVVVGLTAILFGLLARRGSR